MFARISIVCALILSVGSVPAPASAAQNTPIVSRFLSNGDQASANSIDFQSLESMSITVIRSGQGQTGAGTGQAQTTYLSYVVCSNFQSGECESGSGFISNQDLQGSALGGRLTLNTNTTEVANPNLRTNGPGGAIDLTWSKNGYSEIRSQGVTDSRFVLTPFGVTPPLVRVLRSSGLTEGASASVVGTLLTFAPSSNVGLSTPFCHPITT
jgi:hypothetical protein